MSETHPLIAYGEAHDLDRRQVRELFDIPESTFKQLVTGHTGASWERATQWESASKGEVSAESVMRWQQQRRENAA